MEEETTKGAKDEFVRREEVLKVVQRILNENKKLRQCCIIQDDELWDTAKRHNTERRQFEKLLRSNTRTEKITTALMIVFGLAVIFLLLDSYQRAERGQVVPRPYANELYYLHDPWFGKAQTLPVKYMWDANHEFQDWFYQTKTGHWIPLYRE